MNTTPANCEVDQGRLPLKPIIMLIGLAIIWGTNLSMVKIGARDFSPIFMAGLRSAVSAFCLIFYIRAKGEPLFPSRVQSFHGLMVGLIFGLEFAFLFFGVQRTLASRAYVLLYFAPFSAALGAHFFLDNDRLCLNKTLGLILAFFGVAALFIKDWRTLAVGASLGDFMALIAGILWGATTVYLKKYMAGRISAAHSLFYMLFFSAPILFGLSLIFEDQMIIRLTWMGGLSIFYQSIIVAFISYVAWMDMVHVYPISLLHAFSFFTPCFGVFLSGAIFLGEPITMRLLASLALVSLGLVMVNRPQKIK